ncbi:hypothetical protein GM51_4805 [freshwater metagenome]|uniref:ABC-2 type transporter domain-containing protein n=1 Tax=freshwater metagenome TaxID=449393 RepID=A0A094R1H5_9ZZZZ
MYHLWLNRLMIELIYPQLKSRLWFNADLTESPPLINKWINIFDRLGLVKKKNNLKISNYNQVLKYSNIFEVIVSAHIVINRLISGTQLGKINFFIKSFGITLGYLVLIFAATNSSDISFIISTLLIIPLWSLMENITIRISLAIVNSKGILEKINIKFSNFVGGICLASIFEFSTVFLLLILISCYIDFNLTINFLPKIIFLGIGLTFVFIIFASAVSIMFHKIRDQKFILPILMKILLVFTPFLPLIKNNNDIISILITLNPTTYLFQIIEINNLYYEINRTVSFMSFVIFILLNVLIIYIKRVNIRNPENTLGSIIVKRS